MERYNLHLKGTQLEALKALADEREETVSRLIRDAVDAYLRGVKIQGIQPPK